MRMRKEIERGGDRRPETNTEPSPRLKPIPRHQCREESSGGSIDRLWKNRENEKEYEDEGNEVGEVCVENGKP